MSEDGLASHRRDPIKSSVIGNMAANRRRQYAVSVGKERREALMQTKRMCREGPGSDEISLDQDMTIDEEQTTLDAQTSKTVEELKSAVRIHGYSLLRNPHHNKGLAFEQIERDVHYLRGLLCSVCLPKELQEKKLLKYSNKIKFHYRGSWRSRIFKY